jgi:hypothetical protein
MQQAKCIKNSTNDRKFGVKVTHRYHSVDALNFFSLPKEVPVRANAWVGFWGRVRELRAWTRG